MTATQPRRAITRWVTAPIRAFRHLNEELTGRAVNDPAVREGRTFMRVRRSYTLAIIAGGALLLAACGGATATTSSTSAPATATSSTSAPTRASAIGAGTPQASGGSLAAQLTQVSSEQAPAAVIKVQASGQDTASHQVGAGKPRYSRGFHIWNLTSYPLTLEALSGGDFEGRPDLGHVLMPGTYDDFEVTFYFFNAQQITATYTTPQHMSVYPTMRVSDTTGTPASWCSAGSGLACTPTDHEVDQTTITALDPPGTVLDIPASQGQAQAAALKQLCIDTSAATCAFTATGETHLTGAEHQIGVTLQNKTTDPAEYKLTCADTVGHTDSVGVDVSVGGSLFHILDVEITGSYGHEWTASHQFSSEVTFTVKPGEKGWVTDAAPLIRDTGDFTITMGNTTWHLRGIYFDSPDPGGNAIWTTYTQPITGGPVTKVPNTTAPATTAVTGDDKCTSA
jgi:hypothetical protein